jgi:hypothetical protein
MIDEKVRPEAGERDTASAEVRSRSRGLPRRTVLNFLLDATLLMLFLCLGGVSAIVYFIFPPGPESDGWTLWGADYREWCDFQFGVLSTFALAVLLHVMLHWDWVCTVSCKFATGRALGPDDGSRTLYGVALLIALLTLLGAAMIVAGFTIRRPA